MAVYPTPPGAGGGSVVTPVDLTMLPTADLDHGALSDGDTILGGAWAGWKAQIPATGALAVEEFSASGGSTTLTYNNTANKRGLYLEDVPTECVALYREVEGDFDFQVSMLAGINAVGAYKVITVAAWNTEADDGMDRHVGSGTSQWNAADYQDRVGFFGTDSGARTLPTARRSWGVGFEYRVARTGDEIRFYNRAIGATEWIEYYSASSGTAVAPNILGNVCRVGIMLANGSASDDVCHLGECSLTYSPYERVGSILDAAYIGDGSSVSIGIESGGLRTVTGGGLDGLVLFDPESDITSMSTTAGTTSIVMGGVGSSAHYSLFSGEDAHDTNPTLLVPGAIGDGSYIEVADLECTSHPAYSFARITVGLYSLKQDSARSWGRWAGMEMHPAAPNDYYACGSRISTSAVTHTAATITVGVQHTFRVEVRTVSGAPNEMELVFLLDGVQVGTPMPWAPIAGANLAIGFGSGAYTWRFGECRVGVLRY